MAKRKCDPRRPWGYPADMEAMPAEDAVIHFATACRCGWHKEGLKTKAEAERLTAEHMESADD